MMDKTAFPSLLDFAVIVDPQRDHAAVAKQFIPAGTQMLNEDGQVLTLRAKSSPGTALPFGRFPPGNGCASTGSLSPARAGWNRVTRWKPDGRKRGPVDGPGKY
jgi:hypothetical protein